MWLEPGTEDHCGLMQVPDDLISEIDTRAPGSVLGAWSPTPCPPGCTCLEPFTDGFPTALIRSGSGDRSQRVGTIRTATDLCTRWASFDTLGLVEAARPADVPAVLRWAGICNYWHQDLVGISVVLRSWEERFGATLVSMSRSTLILAVADPPRTQSDAEHVAAEHFAFCPDQHDPQNGTVYTPRTYAHEIRGRREWLFWWD